MPRRTKGVRSIQDSLEDHKSVKFHSQLISWYKSNPDTETQETISFYTAAGTIVHGKITCNVNPRSAV